MFELSIHEIALCSLLKQKEVSDLSGFLPSTKKTVGI